MSHVPGLGNVTSTLFHCLTASRSSKPPSPDSFDVIVLEIEFSQGYLTVTDSCTNEIAFEDANKQYTLLQHSCKDLCPRCPGIADSVFTEIEERQRWALPHYSCKIL